jgi:quinol monooxygenase YgiN
MLANVAIYRIKAAHVETFKQRVKLHAKTSLRNEEGCIRFDVNQSRDDPTLFLMYEMFRDRAALDIHGKAPHVAAFLRDRDAEGWLAERTVYQLDQLFSDGAKA